MSAAGNMQASEKRMNNDEVRIVLVGKTGVGKSATGNTILGKEEFESELSSSSQTSDCKKVQETVDGRSVAVIDTPGIFDTNFSQEETIKKIKLCISLSAPGPHVFLVIIQLGRFTKEEKETLEIIKGIFGEASSRYTMVLFTHGDKLKKSKKTIEDFVKESPDLREFIQSTSGLYQVFNNEDEDRKQVTALFEKIDQLIATNGGEHYTNEMLQLAEREINKQVVILRKANPRLGLIEARKTAEWKNDFLDMDWETILAICGGVFAAVLAAVAGTKCTIQ